MAFTSAKEALFFLGLTEKAGREQVKSAYKEQIKAYHPDSNPDHETPWQYYDLQEAYEYLMQYYDGLDRLATDRISRENKSATNPTENVMNGFGINRQASSGPTIFGAKKDLKDLSFQKKVRADHVKQERRSKERAKKQKENFQKEVDKYKQDKAYEEAMTKIRANRAAEITAQIIEAYLKGK